MPLTAATDAVIEVTKTWRSATVAGPWKNCANNEMQQKIETDKNETKIDQDELTSQHL